MIVPILDRVLIITVSKITDTLKQNLLALRSFSVQCVQLCLHICDIDNAKVQC